jgi:hypothetical protein
MESDNTDKENAQVTKKSTRQVSLGVISWFDHHIKLASLAKWGHGHFNIQHLGAL